MPKYMRIPDSIIPYNGTCILMPSNMLIAFKKSKKQRIVKKIEKLSSVV